MENRKPYIKLLGNWILFLLCSLFLGGCVVGAGSSGRALQRSLEAEAIFQQGTFLPEHTYYMQGIYPNPEAIIAVSNAFQLQSRLWGKVDWTKKEFETAVFWMEQAETFSCSTDGGYLVAPDGQRIGLWYSQRDVSVVKQLAAGVVEIYSFEFSPGSSCHRQYLMDQR